MIPDPQSNEQVLPAVLETFETRASRLLSADDCQLLSKYLAKGGLPLAASTAAAFYQVFLSGTPLTEIHALNKAFPYEAILHAYVSYDWPASKAVYCNQLQEGSHDLMLKANFETLGLLSLMLSVAHKQHGEKFRKFLQTGNQKDLEGAMTVDSIHQLLRVLESITKAMTGSGKQPLAPTVFNQQFNVSGGTVNAMAASPDAAKALADMAASKRKGKETV